MRRAVRRGLSALLKRPAMAWAKRSTFASFTSTVGRNGFKLKKPSCIMVVVDNEASGSGATVGGRDLSGAILRRGRPCSWREEQKGTTPSGRGRAILQITWRVSVEAHSMIHCSIRHSPTLYSPDSPLGWEVKGLGTCLGSINSITHHLQKYSEFDSTRTGDTPSYKVLTIVCCSKGRNLRTCSINLYCCRIAPHPLLHPRSDRLELMGKTHSAPCRSHLSSRLPLSFISKNFPSPSCASDGFRDEHRRCGLCAG